jgi:hypothetical protein
MYPSSHLFFRALYSRLVVLPYIRRGCVQRRLVRANIVVVIVAFSVVARVALQ